MTQIRFTKARTRNGEATFNAVTDTGKEPITICREEFEGLTFAESVDYMADKVGDIVGRHLTEQEAHDLRAAVLHPLHAWTHDVPRGAELVTSLDQMQDEEDEREAVADVMERHGIPTPPDFEPWE